MLDKTSLQEYNKGRLALLKILFLIIAVILLFTGLFFNYKQEVLICLRKNDQCYIQKTNTVNMKKLEPIIKMSEIKAFGYIPKTVAGNMYARGYTAYYLTFTTKKKENINIFSTEYYDKDEVKKIVDELNTELLKKSEKIMFERN